MNAFSKHRLLFALFIVSFLAACETFVSAEWRDMDIWVEPPRTDYCWSWPCIIVTIHWTPLDEPVQSHEIYADGMGPRGGHGFVVYLQDWPEAYGSSHLLARLREYASQSHSFRVVAVLFRRDDRGRNVEVYDEISAGPWPVVATEPNPPDGATGVEPITSLTWLEGVIAGEHDIYFGDNFEDVEGADVNDITGIYRGRQLDVIYTPSETLRFGQTYYWRIDEFGRDDITDKGDVWSFTVTPQTAYNPNPLDGDKFVDLQPVLSWSPGWSAQTHFVYFDDNFDDVDAGIGDTYKGPMEATRYIPGPLELEKVYYWRVDEFDGLATHKGNVWSFTTRRAGGGIKGEYFNNIDLSGMPVLTRIDPQINFNWGDGSPDPLVGADEFSVRWTGEVEAAFNETYTFYTNSDDGVRLWVDNRLIINNWTTSLLREEKNGKIRLAAGQTYSIIMEFYESEGDAVAELRWSSPHTPKQLIPQPALSLLFRAHSPQPSKRATGVIEAPTLSWTAGDQALRHDVYFGADQEAVRNANTGSPEYKGTRDLGSESYEPGMLEWYTTYYWRVDEVNSLNPDSPWVGNVWSFTTGADPLSEALDTLLRYTTGGSKNWFHQTTTSYYDGEAAESGNISDSQHSWMRTTVSGTGTVKFYWKVSSEHNFDFLEFYIDGSLKDRISGSVDWQQERYTITTSGSHLLEWRYTKDEWQSNGNDCGWVDKVEWVTLPEPPPPPPDPLAEALDTDLSFTTGGSAEWFRQTSTFYYDADAAQSGDISHSQESWLQTTVNGIGTVKFYWKVSSERRCDLLEFYIDGSRLYRTSGSEDWRQRSHTITTLGSHTLKWRYVKDAGMNLGSDCGWVDKVEWVSD